MKTRNLITLLGITILSLIPKQINENYTSKIEVPEQVKEIKYEAKKLSKEELSNYNKQINDLKDEIKLLDAKRNFFLGRLNETDTFSKRKGFYLKELKETEKELNQYSAKKDSIYKLIRN